MTVMTMSAGEISRFDTLMRVQRGELRVMDAMAVLGLERSQVFKLLARLRDEGPSGMISRKRGRPSNRRFSDAFRERVITIVRERYADFGPTLAAEYLAERHGISIIMMALRPMMMEAGVWTAKRAKRAQLHQMRHGRDRRGELVQVDGSDHDWFEGRGPRCTLRVYIDDATSELMHLEMAETESTFSYMRAMTAYLKRRGKPVAFYSKKHSAFRNNNATADGDGMTHLGRAFDRLDIGIICANSPQAKGRVERANGMLQDRLVKAMRLEGASSIKHANAFLPTYPARHNKRFARPPRVTLDTHRPLAPRDAVDAEMVWREERTVTKSLPIHFNKAIFILDPTPAARSLAGKRVQICGYTDGRVEVRHNHRALPYAVFDKMRQVNQAEIVDSKRLRAALAMAQAMQEVRPHHRKRNNNEPARSSGSFTIFAPSLQPDAAKLDRRRLCTPKLKRELRLSNDELIARGLGEHVR